VNSVERLNSAVYFAPPSVLTYFFTYLINIWQLCQFRWTHSIILPTYASLIGFRSHRFVFASSFLLRISLMQQ